MTNLQVSTTIWTNYFHPKSRLSRLCEAQSHWGDKLGNMSRPGSQADQAAPGANGVNSIITGSHWLDPAPPFYTRVHLAGAACSWVWSLVPLLANYDAAARTWDTLSGERGSNLYFYPGWHRPGQHPLHSSACRHLAVQTPGRQMMRVASSLSRYIISRVCNDVMSVCQCFN